MSTTDRTTVTIPRELHRRVFGDDGMKPHSTMANWEFLEEMADTYEENQS